MTIESEERELSPEPVGTRQRKQRKSPNGAGTPDGPNQKPNSREGFIMKVVKNLSEVNFSIEKAAKAGYKISLDSDGCAEVRKPGSTAYHIHNFNCDCPDAWNRNGGSYILSDGRHICKHVALILQFRPCPICGSVMMRTGAYFECIKPGCGYAFDTRLVKEQRQAMTQQMAKVA